MSEPFIGEIRIFAGNFAPRNFAFCDGQLLPIAQNTALFAILGTTYGGDGRTTLALPNLQGRIPVHAGNGPGLSNRSLGQQGGVQTVALASAQMPSHAHAVVTPDLQATTNDPNTSDPRGNTLAAAEIYRFEPPSVDMHTESINEEVGDPGGNQAHQNMSPYLAVNFIIALQGVFPSRS